MTRYRNGLNAGAAKVLDDLEEQHVQTHQQVLEDANDETHECRR